MRKFLSGPIQNEGLTVNSEKQSSDDHFERKFRANISPSDQGFEKQEEELIKFKERYHDKFRKFLLGTIQNELLTIASEHLFSKDHFERKFQANISPSDQDIEINKKN